MTNQKMLQRGDLVPHVEFRTVDGSSFGYKTIWQHKNLVLVTVLETDDVSRYLTELEASQPDFDRLTAVVVATREAVPGVPRPGALIADRWGEIVHVEAPADSSRLPRSAELLEWVDYVARRCAECEGEAR